MNKNKELIEKYTKVKEILKRLHKHESPEQLKEELSKILSTITPWEIGFIEQMLIADGIKPLEIAFLCNTHVDLFKDRIVEDKKLLELPNGHPLNTLLRESQELLNDGEKLTLYANMLRHSNRTDIKDTLTEIHRLLVKMFGVKKHFTRLQMLVFPYLERKGLTAIPRVLWTRQDQLIGLLKASLRILNNLSNNNTKYSLGSLAEKLEELAKETVNMVFRETRILYPTLRILLSEGEWAAIRLEEDSIGYYNVSPGDEWKPSTEPILPYMIHGIEDTSVVEELPKEVRNMLSAERDEYRLIRDNDLKLGEGYLSGEELDAILRTLPVDISFIDKHDRLRYYSLTSDRIFIRTKTTLGRPVTLCHPPKSVHIVEKIINEFKAGRRDKAEFWINMGGRLIYITYYPVRNNRGEYLGTLEVVQDITDLKKIEGEKRILDWS